MFKHTFNVQVLIVYTTILLNCQLFPFVVEPTLSFSTVDEVVEEDEARAEVCLMLNIPLDTPLDVSVTSATGSG